MLSIIVAVILDILIAIAMTILLAREWKSPLLPRTSRMLQRLMVFAINTGTWTAAFALTSLALMYAYPSTILSAITTTPVCAIYANTLLANLNAREAVREAGATDGGTDTFRFTVSGLPVSGGNEHEESKTSESSPTPSKVGIVPGEDAWQPMKEVASENV
ncbi:hypothetical protein JVU11DRAFT_6647 [Chiua virens]|nr:hypothetical protein JVU11DRAFT_6647 [Chiua virens]